MNMKHLIVLLFCLSICSCVKTEQVERHELTLQYVDCANKDVCLYDITSGQMVIIHFSPDLFCCSFMQICQVKGNPYYVFLFSGNQYYRL